MMKRILPLPLTLLLLLSACTVRLISDYDPQTDVAVTNLQRQVELLFLQLGEDVAAGGTAYATYRPRYQELSADLEVLILRNELREKNELTLRQLQLYRENLAELRAYHEEDGFASVEELAPMRDAMRTSAQAILTLELAKKRQERGDR